MEKPMRVRPTYGSDLIHATWNGEKTLCGKAATSGYAPWNNASRYACKKCRRIYEAQSSEKDTETRDE